MAWPTGEELSRTKQEKQMKPDKPTDKEQTSLQPGEEFDPTQVPEGVDRRSFIVRSVIILALSVGYAIGKIFADGTLSRSLETAV